MVSIEEFAERLIRLGARWQPRPLPRRRFDREILMKSILLVLDSGRIYTEPQINAELQLWNIDVAPAIQTDHVTVRRMLVDYGYLERTPDGSAYRVGFPPKPLAFELEVEDLDVRATIAAYREAHPRPQRQDELPEAH
jgi:hypothetical protein